MMSTTAPACTYVILAHQHPDAVVRLAAALFEEAPASRVVVHYSAAAGPFPTPADPRIVVVEDPVAVQWGTYSQVEMLLKSLDQVRRSHLPDSWVVVLSGQSYPVRGIAEFEQTLMVSQTDAFIWCTPIDGEELLRERSTFRYRQIAKGPLPFPLNRRPVRGVINRSQPFIRIKSSPRISFFGIAKRSTIFDLVPRVYHSTQWIALSRRAVRCITDTIAARPQIVEAYRHSMFAEESLFATILMNDPALRVHRDDFHYVDWSTIRTGSPKTLTVADLGPIVASGKTFARKIDLESNDPLRDELDRLRRLKLDAMAVDSPRAGA